MVCFEDTIHGKPLTIAARGTARTKRNTGKNSYREPVSIIQKAVHTYYMTDQMVLRRTDALKNKRDDLTNQRNVLFNSYLRNPNDLALAVEIKTIDDAIADCTEKTRQGTLSERKSKLLAGTSKS